MFQLGKFFIGGNTNAQIFILKADLDFIFQWLISDLASVFHKKRTIIIF
jgi:hypothetical protein